MKQYRLKKDFFYPSGLYMPKNTISSSSTENNYIFSCNEGNDTHYFSKDFVESNTEFFEEVSNRWKPLKEQLFWYIDYDGLIESGYWNDADVNIDTYNFGNIFPTREAAEKARDKVKSLLLELQEEK